MNVINLFKSILVFPNPSTFLLDVLIFSSILTENNVITTLFEVNVFEFNDE